MSAQQIMVAGEWQETGTVLARNLATNPSFEINTAGWVTNRLTATAQVSTSAQRGARRALLTVTEVGYFPRIHQTPGIAAAPGEQVTASIYKADFSGVPTRLAVQFLNGSTAVALVEATPVAGFSQRVSITTTAPANTTQFSVWTGVPDNTPIGTVTALDGLLIQKAPALGPYFDGDTPDIQGIRYVWTGTPHASTSEARETAPPLGVIVEPHMVLGYEAISDVPTNVHQLLGGGVTHTIRDALPRRGTLELLFLDHAAAVAAFDLLRTPHLFSYTDTEQPQASMSFYVVGEMQLALEPQTGTRWIVSVPFSEVIT